MPKIQEYEQQVGAQGPTGGVSPNLEVASETGRAAQSLGSSLEQLGDAVQRRNEQAETSSVYAQMSQVRSKYTEQLNQQIQQGTLDVDQFKQDYQDDVNKVGENLSTDGGQNFFQRQAARVGGALLQHAIAGQAQQAGEKAAANFQTSLNSNSDSLYQNPHDFENVKDSMNEYIDKQVATGALPAKRADELKLKAGQSLAESSLRGYMQINPDAAKSVLDSGAYDQYIKGDDKYKMYAEVKTFANGQEIEKKRAQKAIDDATAARAEDWKQGALPLLTKNALTPKTVLNQPDLDSSEKLQWLNLIKKGNEDQGSNPATVNSVMQRLVLPDNDPRKITTIEQVEPMLGKGISMSNMEQINTWIQKKSPEGLTLNSQRKMLMDYAKGKLVNANPMLGIKDPEGERNFSVFTNALIQQETALRKAGKNPSDLYDEKSPDSFWDKVPGYVKTPQQIMQGMADQTRQGAAPPGPGQPPPEDMVNVVDKNGQLFKIPKSNLEKAKSRGFKVKDGQ